MPKMILFGKKTMGDSKKSPHLFANNSNLPYICNTNKKEIERIKEIHKNLLPIFPQ